LLLITQYSALNLVVQLDMAAFQPAKLISSQAVSVLTLAEAYVAVVPTKHVVQLIKCLTNDLPLGTLQHLKRVRKADQQADGQQHVQVLLCLTGPWQQQQQQQQQADRQQPQQTAGQQQHAELSQHQQDPAVPAPFPPAITQLLQECTAEVTTCQVPVTLPTSREQWQEWCRVWPMPWRSPAGDAHLDGQPAPPGDQQYFQRSMQLALTAAAAAEQRNVAVIIDPATGQVLAQAADCSLQHPLDHAAMVAIEAVAARDRKLWPYNGFVHSGRHEGSPDAAGYSAVAPLHVTRSVCNHHHCTDGNGSPPNKKQKADSGQQAHQQQQQEHDANWPGGQAKAQLEAADPGSVVAAPCTAGPSSAAAVDCDSKAHWSAKPYLCTGFDCFLVREPCTMCAMALVHSRVARVVYCMSDTQHGALGGSYRLHSQRSLNHHYKVYHMPLQQE
jgi:tRNA-specific adenosine deaminase 3